MKDWEIKLLLKEKESKLKEKYPLLGKKVRRKNRSKWEEGIIVLDNFDGREKELFIEYLDGSKEQLDGLPFEIWNDKLNLWIKN